MGGGGSLQMMWKTCRTTGQGAKTSSKKKKYDEGSHSISYLDKGQKSRMFH